MHLQSKLDFDETFDVLGGKLAQWQDFALDFANADGALSGPLHAMSDLTDRASAR